jgi:prephenate dehydratase
MSGSVLQVAFQGELGAYSEEALRAFFGDSAEPLPCRDFGDVGDAVDQGRAAFGLLPIENTLAGSVVASYDVLAATDLAVVGEVILPIHHHLLARPGAALAGLRRVLSHPVALAQCRRFFADHPQLEQVSHYDTAGAARAVAEGDDAAAGAIASRLAGDRYGLDVLAAGIEDRPDNQTRFLIVCRPGHPLPQRADAAASGPRRFRTSLLAETANAPGSLVRLLQPFAERGVNLIKLESRPGEQPWTYRFFMELDGSLDAEPVRIALADARAHATSVRVLGSYPRWARGEGVRE